MSTLVSFFQIILDRTQSLVNCEIPFIISYNPKQVGNHQYPHCPEIESHRRAHFPWVNRVTEVDEDTTAYHVEVGGVVVDVVVDLYLDVDVDGH